MSDRGMMTSAEFPERSRSCPKLQAALSREAMIDDIIRTFRYGVTGSTLRKIANVCCQSL
jgi:hypothetical protein